MSAKAQLQKQPKCFWCTSILFRKPFHKRLHDFLKEDPADLFAHDEINLAIGTWTVTLAFVALNIVLNWSFLKNNLWLLLHAIAFGLIARSIVTWVPVMFIFWFRIPNQDMLGVMFPKDGVDRGGCLMDITMWLRKRQSREDRMIVFGIRAIAWTILLGDLVVWTTYPF